MNYLRFDNIDCFELDNYLIKNFETIDKCILVCKEIKLNLFVVNWENKKVYFKNKNIKLCLQNIKFNKDTTLIIYDSKNCAPYLYTESNLLSFNERLKIYYPLQENDETKNLIKLKWKQSRNLKEEKWIDNTKNPICNLKKIKKFLKNNIENGKSKDRLTQHYGNFNTWMNGFIKSYWIHYNKSNNFMFHLNPWDLSWSLDTPTFTKSRVLEDPKNSVLLPLENLYIPNYFTNILNDDIPYDEKLNTCVWRGANSGDFFGNKNRPNRSALVIRHRFNEKYDIGLSYANYKYKSKTNEPWEHGNPEDYVRDIKTIKDQLKYKFILSLEGNDIGTNLSWIMLSNSVLLMTKPFIESWRVESKMKPYKHYVPLKKDFSDLDEIMNWCLKNDKKCKEIAFNSRLFALQFFDISNEKKICEEIIKKYYYFTMENQHT